MMSFDRDSHEENAHRDFAENRSKAVGNFAEPPILCNSSGNLAPSW
jgi:hypothetical protein